MANLNVPGWWQLTLLSLFAYRVTRLIGWDDLPAVVRWRSWLTGAYWQIEPDETGSWQFERPGVAHFIACPFCVGFWVSATIWVSWLAFPHVTLVAATPYALSAVVGLVAKRLDP